MISREMIGHISNSSVIRALFEEGKRLSGIYGAENVFDFSIGSPNVEPPATIKQAIFDILNEESPNLVHGYMNNSGYIDVRQKVAQHLNLKHQVKLDESNVLMTCGAAGGLNVLLKTLLNPGDEVITFSPYFLEYKNYVSNYHGELIVVPTNIEDFAPNMEALRAAITPKTKALMINSPNNPTGVIYSEKVIKELAVVLEEKQAELGISIYLISDEPYREVCYDGVEVPYVLKFYRNSFIGYSYSKSLSLPGERIGYIIAHGEMDDFDIIIQALNTANRILGFVNAPSLFQRVIGRCLDSEVDVNIYKRNRDLLYSHLTSIGFKCVKPQGAFYLFPQSLIPDDKLFTEEAKKHNLLIVPGSAFACPGHFRLSYCISYEKIEKSLEAFTKLAAQYK
jgi:aspartate aminotransferase